MSTRQNKNMADDTIEWRGVRGSARVNACLLRVLSELTLKAQLALRDKRLQVEVMKDPKERHYSVWAYFPAHRRRWIARQVRLKRATRILIVLSETVIANQPLRETRDELRDHLGHTLLYLRNPRAPNECEDARREWDRSCA
jgi:hypothetical protein